MTRVARPGEINGDFVDRYTLGHAAAGVLMEAARLPWWATLLLAIGWELVEHPFKDGVPDLFPNATQDTFANSAGDVLGVMAGWALMRGVEWWGDRSGR